MTPQTILDSMRRTVVCRVCLGSSGHPAIEGDGALVCYVCVLSLGRMAADPMSADPERLVDIAMAHADVVELKACAEHKGGCWAWTGWAA